MRIDATHLSAWLKNLAPSDDLRTWFAHDPSRWLEFQECYRAELQAPEKEQMIRELAQKLARERLP